MRSLIVALTFGLTTIVVTPVWAEISVPSAYELEAKQNNIPPVVLFALALVESGRTLPNKVFRPWPWTLTINAKPYFFSNREDADAKLQEVLAGEKPNQLGVGLMQVEWRFHKQRFSNSSMALDPYQNLKVGAQIFSEYWKETGNLWDAIGRYHSKTPKHATRYKNMVGDRLVRLLAQNGS